MPREGVTVYDILLSCPGDVAKFKNIVRECIEDFNRLYGELNNIKLELKHWSEDAYPQSGGSAQGLLNSQFIHDCDACIALLGNRFGTPTERYDSGTEEEIEDMISSGKQVFMYFIEEPVNPSSIDITQYSKVQSFKEKYISNSKGIYWTIKDENEFKIKLSNHLGLYFLELLVKPEFSLDYKKLPRLEVELDENHITQYKDLNTCKLVSTIEDSIEKNISLINDIHISTVEATYIEESELDKKSYENSNNIINNRDLYLFTKPENKEYEKVQFNYEERQRILNYCSKKNIILEEDFWNLGNLKEVKETKFSIITGYSNSNNLEGTEDEKKKYELIEELICYIYKYDSFIEYFKAITSYNCLNLYIKNIGTSFDEDIDISITVPTENLIKNDEIPIPNFACIEEINESNLINKIFCALPNANIKKYSDYPISGLTQTLPNMLLNNRSMSERYKYEKEEYLNDIKRIFCYEYYEEEGNTIIKFNLNYLKQNISMYFPSILLFRNQPKSVEYEIKSKYYPQIIKETLLLY